MLTQKLLGLTAAFGADWVNFVLVGVSIVGLGVFIDRVVFYLRTAERSPALRDAFSSSLAAPGLATIGNIAPLIGRLGTVIGSVGAIYVLGTVGTVQASSNSQVMSSIGEALSRELVANLARLDTDGGAAARLEDITRQVEAARARAAASGAEARLAGFVSADVDAPYGRFAEAVDQLRIAGVSDIALDTQPPTTP